MTDPQTGIFLVAWSITVSDPQQSIRFYEALGFKHCGGSVRTVERDSEMARMMGLQSAKTRVDYLARPDGRLELNSFEEPKSFSKGALKPANRTGANAMHFGCADANALAKRLVELGGKIIAGSDGRYAMADPDGVRIQFASAKPEMIKAVFGE